MAYAVIRISKKLSSKNGYIGCFKHNSRNQEETEKNQNVDHSKSHLNVYDGINTYQEFIAYKENDLKDKVKKKDSVFCVEMVLTASPEFFKDKTDLEVKKWYSDNKNYLKSKYGENFIGCTLHLDETTPHIHAYVVPLDKDKKLNAKEVFNQNACREMQEDYPKFMQSCGHDLKRGEPDKAVKHTNQKEFSTAVNKAIASEEKQEKAFYAGLEKVIDNTKVSLLTGKDGLKNEILSNVKNYIKENFKGVYCGLMKLRELKKDVGYIYKKNKELTTKNKELELKANENELKFNSRENVLDRLKKDNAKLESELSNEKEQKKQLQTKALNLQNKVNELELKYEPKFKGNKKINGRDITR